MGDPHPRALEDLRHFQLEEPGVGVHPSRDAVLAHQVTRGQVMDVVRGELDCHGSVLQVRGEGPVAGSAQSGGGRERWRAGLHLADEATSNEPEPRMPSSVGAHDAKQAPATGQLGKASSGIGDFLSQVQAGRPGAGLNVRPCCRRGRSRRPAPE